jgi:hypothetical protein
MGSNKNRIPQPPGARRLTLLISKRTPQTNRQREEETAPRLEKEEKGNE